MEIKTILVPTDFSGHSTKALQTAVDMAKTLGASVHLVHVLHFPVQVAAPGQVAIPQDLWTQIRDGAARRLEKAREAVAASGIAVETHLSEGANAQAIVELAEKVKADLIVMGTRGLSGLKHVMLGSVAERTVRLAPCAVMTVKAEQE
jgi:nucleotide-binding universal stress UspA family protein